MGRLEGPEIWQKSLDSIPPFTNPHLSTHLHPLQLEAMLTEYAVPLAIVDGKGLAHLAQVVVETEIQPGIQVCNSLRKVWNVGVEP